MFPAAAMQLGEFYVRGRVAFDRRALCFGQLTPRRAARRPVARQGPRGGRTAGPEPLRRPAPAPRPGPARTWTHNQSAAAGKTEIHPDTSKRPAAVVLVSAVASPSTPARVSARTPALDRVRQAQGRRLAPSIMCGPPFGWVPHRACSAWGTPSMAGATTPRRIRGGCAQRGHFPPAGVRGTNAGVQDDRRDQWRERSRGLHSGRPAVGRDITGQSTFT